MPKLPESTGKYKITSRLGKGGMSILYLAEHPSLGTTVVLKKLTLKGDSAHRERFRREATLMMKLRHENVVGVYDHFKEGASHYLVMEYVDGRPLSELMAREGALPESESRWLAGCLARALVHIHSRGIIHRDLKPSNVLLGSDGKVKLGDFGIAFTPNGSDNITSGGTSLGTPAFMAPEQLEDARGADERSDIWSFGVCFFEMLTGRKFVVGASPAAVRESLPNAVKTMRSRLPSGLSRRHRRLLRKTLRMNPESRLKDGQALIRLLGTAGQSESPPETLQVRMDQLLESMKSVTETTTKAEGDSEKVDLGQASGSQPSLQSLFGFLRIRSRKRSKKNPPTQRTQTGKRSGILTAGIMILVFLFTYFAVSLIFPGVWDSVLRRNSYGVFRLKLVFPPDASEYWLTAASASIYQEDGDNSILKLLTPSLHPSGKEHSLVSRRIILPVGAYRIMWSLGDKVSWYSFRLSSFSEARKSGARMMVLEETLDDPPAFSLELSWLAVDAVNGGDIKDQVTMNWKRMDQPGGEVVSGGTYKFWFTAPGYLPVVFDVAVNPWRRNLNFHASFWPQPAELTLQNNSASLIMPQLNGSGRYLDMESSPEVHRVGRITSGASSVLYLLPGEYKLTPGLGKSVKKDISLQPGGRITVVFESDDKKKFLIKILPENP